MPLSMGGKHRETSSYRAKCLGSQQRVIGCLSPVHRIVDGKGNPRPPTTLSELRASSRAVFGLFSKVLHDFPYIRI